MGFLIYVQKTSMRGNTLSTGTGTDTDHDHDDDFTDWERSILNRAGKYGVDSNPMVVDCSPRAHNREGLGRTRSSVDEGLQPRNPFRRRTVIGSL